MRASLRSVLFAAGLLAAVIGSVWCLSEARRTAGRNLLLEDQASSLGTELAAARDELAARDERITYLETELAAAIARADEIARAVDDQRAALERDRAALQELRVRERAPMPEGVRLALRAVESLLRADGYPGLRFLEAAALDERVLRDVELIETTAGGRTACYYRAAELLAHLDRAGGTLTLELRDGHALTNGVLEPLPESGLRLEFRGVHGPEWERRLPYLVTATGEYPVPPDGSDGVDVMDPFLRERWRARLCTLLAAADTELDYTVGGFRTARDGRFLDASVHGHDGERLEQSADAKALAIEVDRTTDVVSLLLEDGILRKRGGETTIPTSGYRILLPGLDATFATDVMLGFVVDRK